MGCRLPGSRHFPLQVIPSDEKFADTVAAPDKHNRMVFVVEQTFEGSIRFKKIGLDASRYEISDPLENGHIESFNGKLRDELLGVEIFDTLLEAKVLIERWRWEYNTIRPHSSLGYRPPAPEAVQSRC